MNKIQQLIQKYNQEREVLNQLNILTNIREELENLKDIEPYKDLGEMPKKEFENRKNSATRMNFEELLQRTILA